MEKEKTFNFNIYNEKEFYYNPITQYLLKYRDCSNWEKIFLKLTEKSTFKTRKDILKSINDLIPFPILKYEINDFIKAYRKAKKRIENLRKPDLLAELKALKKSPERMEALAKAIKERVYSPKVTDPLMLNPLYKTITSGFVKQFKIGCNTVDVRMSYRDERGIEGLKTVDELKETIFKNTDTEEKIKSLFDDVFA